MYMYTHSEIGGAISEFYHPNYTPKMKYYDVNIFVHVVNDQVVVGTMVNVTELSRDRHALLFRNQVSIKVGTPEEQQVGRPLLTVRLSISLDAHCFSFWNG